jgi:ABC-type Fe3+ transport system substrate-binding protein
MGLILLLTVAWEDLSPTLISRPVAFAATATTTPSKAAWEVQWEEIIAKAKQEGVVVILGRDPREWDPFVKVFEEKYGVDVQVRGGSSSDLADRLLAERAAKRFTADHALFGTGTTSRVMIPNGLLTPILPELILPEVKDPSKWYKGSLWWASGDQSRKYSLLYAAPVQPADLSSRYNTKKVSRAEYDAINSVWDFLDPKWKGRLGAFAPTENRGSTTDFYIHPAIGPKWFKRFYSEMNAVFFSDQRLIIDQLVLGGIDIALFLGRGTDDDLDALGDRGAPIGNFLGKAATWAEGGFLNLGDGNRSISIMNRAAHPNAAKLFTNWLLSREGQIAWQEKMGLGTKRTPYPTMRVDVASPGRTLPKERRYPGVNYLVLDQLPGVDYNASMAEMLKLFKSTR